MANDDSPVRMVKIEPQNEELIFDGTNVNQFLDLYRMAAQATGASEDDMAQQLGCFFSNDYLHDVAETLEGYEPPNWPKLEASMIAYWGRFKIQRFTLEDFEHLLLSWSEKENISPAEDYQFFCDSLEPIMSYLLRNDDIGTKELQNIYYQAFSQVLQCSLHRSRLALNEDCIRLKIEYQGTTDNSPLLESCSTFFKDVIATTSVPELEERNLDAELEPSEQSIQDSGETVVPLSIPAPSATDPSLFQSEACVKKVVENNYLDVLDNGLGEIPNVIVSDVVVTDSLKEFNAPVSDFALGCYSNRLGFLTRPIPEDRPGEVAMFRERILPLDPTECQIKMPVSSSQVKNDLEGLEDSAGLGDDHNHFIDRRDSSDINFNALYLLAWQHSPTRMSCLPKKMPCSSIVVWCFN
ncbi:hypothetical protein MJO28_002076 [Puccinia striiformis f. sp. tritici]|uniref:Uncharacterized protein n=1 Tax=Puccinia striiformis f. sp. tritici TaxID=168172 RepID=A0ACC0EW49_9BASI|nr:hypothetical protein MJO28_002076 [Puccinia striiformis f. sp. tritici]